jgi:hypothetical protein
MSNQSFQTPAAPDMTLANQQENDFARATHQAQKQGTDIISISSGMAIDLNPVP